MNQEACPKKRVLIVEDEAMITDDIISAFQAWRYHQEIDFLTADTAQEAFRLITSPGDGRYPDLIILDMMMAYGTEAMQKELGADSDLTSIETGRHMLARLRRMESEAPDRFPHYPLYVAVVTARSDIALYGEINDLFQGWGRIYPKPFTMDHLVNDVALVLGIEKRVPDSLLRDHTPPTHRYPVSHETDGL